MVILQLTAPATTCNSRRWFKEEAAVSNGDFEEECPEDEDDLYNNMLATELLHHINNYCKVQI